MTPEQKLRNLPAIDSFLQRESLQTLIHKHGREAVRDRLREVLDEVRTELKSGLENSDEGIIEQKLQQRFAKKQQALTQRVINATGVVLHTNLGRAPLSQTALDAIQQAASGYCNLEFDLATGARGKRGTGLEEMLRDWLGCEAVAVVNNCAAAVYLTLNTLAEGGEIVVSRGELVEIGGAYRLPDVIEKSGATLREVGTTNRTRISDYEKAINEKTKILLRSHTSNFRIVGFTESPSLQELTQLSQKYNIPFFEDLGSGALLDLQPFGIYGEPSVQHSLKSGVPLLAFSGDKLLGGPQAGIILGKREYIDRIKRNPLMRAFRVDKLIFAALEATMTAYIKGNAAQEVPVISALSATKIEINQRAKMFVRRVKNEKLMLKLIDGNSMVGGGSAPDAALPTKLISVACNDFSATQIEAKLRNQTPPIIGRIEDDKFLIDLRTVHKNEEKELQTALVQL
jgi:L-seryl-tRNA(Ser) seleniumtransferase